MNLYFFTQIRLCRINGVVWTTPAFSMPLWNRYLQSFDHVFVCARIIQADKPIAAAMEPCLSDRVSFIDLPYYVGPKQYLQVRRKLNSKIKSLIHPGDAYICRVPGRIGAICANYLNSKHIPYGLEIVGDPWESMSPSACKHLLAPFFQVHGYFSLKRIARNASTALYVTNYTLQKRYPVCKGVFTVGASNVILKDEYYADKAHESNFKGTVNLLSVGTLAQLYKAPDIVIKAVAELTKRGYNVHLKWLGGGQYLESMNQLARELNIADKISMLGAVSIETVRKEMDKADIFVHDSRAEGLPRALIEAMAKGLPAIGSCVAGIPELLDKFCVIKPNRVGELADKIKYLINNPDFAYDQASRNLQESRNYHESILNKRRLDFYSQLVKESTI